MGRGSALVPRAIVDRLGRASTRMVRANDVPLTPPPPPLGAPPAAEIVAREEVTLPRDAARVQLPDGWDFLQLRAGGGSWWTTVAVGFGAGERDADLGAALARIAADGLSAGAEWSDGDSAEITVGGPPAAVTAYLADHFGLPEIATIDERVLAPRQRPPAPVDPATLPREYGFADVRRGDLLLIRDAATGRLEAGEVFWGRRDGSGEMTSYEVGVGGHGHWVDEADLQAAWRGCGGAPS